MDGKRLKIKDHGICSFIQQMFLNICHVLDML